MPPKNQKNPDAAISAKKIADKTFGMKNKNKSKKIQGDIAQMKKTAGVDQPKYLTKETKREAADAAINAILFTEAVSKKDLAKRAIEKANAKLAKAKAAEPEKRDIYTDARKPKEEDLMEMWDEDKLRSVVDSKKSNQNRPTDIVCKHFIDAVEKRQYGWFWECPNGGDTCKYVHALPPGFVLKRDKVDNFAMESGPTLEEELEEKRKALTERTPVTFERLQAWLAAKVAKAKEAEEAELEAARKQYAKGKLAGVSGRMLFDIDSSLFVDDAAAGDLAYEREDSSDDEFDPQDQNQGEALYDRSESSAPPSAPAAAPDAGSAPPQAPMCGACSTDGGSAAGGADGAGGAAGAGADGVAAGVGAVQLTDLDGVDESLFLDDDLPDDDELDGL